MFDVVEQNRKNHGDWWKIKINELVHELNNIKKKFQIIIKVNKIGDERKEE